MNYNEKSMCKKQNGVFWKDMKHVSPHPFLVSHFPFLLAIPALTSRNFPQGRVAIGESQKIIGYLQLMSYFIYYTAENPPDFSFSFSWPSELYRNTNPPRHRCTSV